MRQRIVIADEGGTFASMGRSRLNRDCWVHVRQVNRACFGGLESGFAERDRLPPRPQAPIERGFLRTSKCPLPDSVCFDLPAVGASRARVPARVYQTLQRSAEVRGVRRRSASDRSVRREITHVSSFRGPRGLSDRQRATTAPASVQKSLLLQPIDQSLVGDA